MAHADLNLLVQLRVHCAHILETPIVGDTKYSNVESASTRHLQVSLFSRVKPYTQTAQARGGSRQARGPGSVFTPHRWSFPAALRRRAATLFVLRRFRRTWMRRCVRLVWTRAEEKMRSSRSGGGGDKDIWGIRAQGRRAQMSSRRKRSLLPAQLLSSGAMCHGLSETCSTSPCFCASCPAFPASIKYGVQHVQGKPSPTLS
jgi:hypothetical protein